MKSFEPTKLFEYFNLSKSGELNYPEFELGLDLIVPDLLTTYAHSRMEDPISPTSSGPKEN